MTIQRHAWPSRSFPFDAPVRSGLLSGTTMRRPSVFALRRFRAAHALAVLLVVAACHSAWAFPRHENKAVRKEIAALEQQWREAVLSNNYKEMNQLLADDYVGITSNGAVENKAQTLAQSRAGTVRITELNLSDIRIRIYGNTAVVTSKANLAGTNGASDIGGQYRYTRVYRRRLGSWKIVSFEASRMHDPDVRARKR
jgi:ketosteroid isomerase-like protein